MASTLNADNGAISGSSGLKSSADASGVLALQTNGTTALTIDTSQNVGIGTSSPGQKLHVASSSPATYIQFQNATRSDGYIGYDIGNMEIFTAGAERMRIDSSGNVGIGTTIPTARLDVKTNGNVYNSYCTASIGAGICYIGTRDTDGYIGYWIRGTTFVGGISITASGTTYATSSDYRLKENIAPMTGALDKVSKLKPVTYTWKADGSEGQGFIAHELQEVVPDCVTGEKDAVDKNGEPVYQGIDTSFLVATLTAAIQELKAEIDSLKAQISG